ncbi:MAG: acetylglutamate kinase [candidate division KSB1 bacterium]|nr:acetylglutamate kinase [candidate division KSB1 bacterium]MDZ7364257.1 acetylglutamate kinase [candidate division KSB1 bacterium]MDZ7404980.1 acetylglutamate kinase [candidate division KSB1 bacterium]
MEHLLIIKIGGHVIDQPEALAAFLDDYAGLAGKKILIHGGGKIATDISRALRMEARMVDGRRLTDKETLKVVTMVYGGLINKMIVSGLQARGVNAIGLTGADADVIVAKKRQDKQIDYGYVGDVERVNDAAIVQFLGAGLSPVFAPLTHDRRGSMLNTNADTIAAALASSLCRHYPTRLIYCFEKKGVLASADENAVIPRLTFERYQNLKTEGVISKGMLPKLEQAFAALQAGVAAVILCHAAQLSLAAQGEAPVGTSLVF